jgi:hypothetical protein
MKGNDDRDASLDNGENTGETIVRVDEIKTVASERPTKVEAGFCIRALSMTAVEGKNLHFYSKRAYILDQISNEAPCGGVVVRRVHVGEAQHIHLRLLTDR